MKNDEWSKTVQEYPEANFLQSPEYAKMNDILGNKVVFDDLTGMAMR